MIARLIPFAVLLAATAATAAAPTMRDIDVLRKAVPSAEKCPPMRRVTCTTAGDPTEYVCKWQERWKGKWTKTSTIIGRDGDKWVWLDGGPRCSSLPQH